MRSRRAQSTALLAFADDADGSSMDGVVDELRAAGEAKVAAGLVQ